MSIDILWKPRRLANKLSTSLHLESNNAKDGKVEQDVAQSIFTVVAAAPVQFSSMLWHSVSSFLPSFFPSSLPAGSFSLSLSAGSEEPPVVMNGQRGLGPGPCHYPVTIYYPLSVDTINPGPGNRDLSVLHYQDLPVFPSLPVTWGTHILTQTLSRTHTHIWVSAGFKYGSVLFIQF